MRDKGADILLMVLIGMAGITDLTLAWARPMPMSERILTTCIGSIGIFWVLIQVLLLRSALTKTGVTKVAE